MSKKDSFGPQILIIDDDVDIVDTVKELLSFEYQDIDVSYSVENAHNLLDSKQYDCILLDLNINNVNGATVVKYINESENSKNKGTPIVIISGYITDGFSEKFGDRFQGIISKPFEGQYVLDTLIKIVGYGPDKDQPVVETAPDFADIQPEKPNGNESILDNPNVLEPFKVIEGIEKKVGVALKKIKGNPRLSKLLKEVKVSRDKANYIKTHTGLLINISSAIAKELHWGGESTIEKFVFASYLKDIALRTAPELIRIKERSEVDKLAEEEHNALQVHLILNHPKEGKEICESIGSIPEDVIQMVAQHHERPDGSGFPEGMDQSRISALSAVFIVANDMADYIIERPNWKFEFYLKRLNDKFNGAHFRKIAKALADCN